MRERGDNEGDDVSCQSSSDQNSNSGAASSSILDNPDIR